MQFFERRGSEYFFCGKIIYVTLIKGRNEKENISVKKE
jgi:hypothetical protein